MINNMIKPMSNLLTVIETGGYGFYRLHWKSRWYVHQCLSSQYV